jgi:arsenate reductase
MNAALMVSPKVKLMSDKERILFLCTGNSCRSQMAEGLARHFWGDTFNVSSAGIERHGLNPLAVKAMREIGIDISGHQSKTVDDLPNLKPDYVITVCGHANETCPVFPGLVKQLHVGFDDPPKLAAHTTSEEEAILHYRRVRDEIAAFVRQLPDKLPA